MTRTLSLLSLFLLCIATPLYASDMVSPFTFTDLAGKTYNSNTLKGVPLVINVGAHW